MEKRMLGRSGLAVPLIGMGTWRTFDVQGPRAQAVCDRIVTNALGAGANFFDSSPMYGAAEKVLGHALGARRGEALVATKVWAPSPDEGRRQIARALDYYQGRVEVYQVHNLVNWEFYLPLLEELKARGQTQAVGLTHYAHSAFGQLARLMETDRVDAIQIPYNAVDRAAESELLPLAQELAIGVIVMRPLGEGALAQREPPRARWQALAQAVGVTTWAQVLLKWIVSDPRVHVAIPATSKPERMIENAAAGDPPFFDPDQREEVARLAAAYA